MLLKTLQEVEDFVQEVKDAPFLCVDVETEGLDYLRDALVGIGFATKDKEWYIDFPTLWARGALYSEEARFMQALGQLFSFEGRTLISHNAPFDMYFLWREFFNHCPECYDADRWFLTSMGWWDTMSMAALCDENLIGTRIMLGEDDDAKMVGALSLKALSSVFLGRKQRMYEEDFMEWTVEERVQYGEDDVRNTYDLAVGFSKQLKKMGLLKYYHETVAPMSFVTTYMEMTGLKADIPRLLVIQKEVQALIDDVRQTVVDILPPQVTCKYDAAGWQGTDDELQEVLRNAVTEVEGGERHVLKSGRISTSVTALRKLAPHLSSDDLAQLTYNQEEPANPNSNAQLAKYFIDKGYRLPLTQKGSPSVSKSVLVELSGKHPEDEIWEPLFRMKRLVKLKSTYIDGTLNVAWPDDSVHPQWNQAGTVTGRYSTSAPSRMNKKLDNKRGPALQTVPTPDTIQEAGWDYNPRAWFKAREGYEMCVADLSQAEVRMLAVMSEDEALTQAVRSGEDIHTSLSERVWGSQWEEADAIERKALRQHTKMVTFGTIYGIGPVKLAENLGKEEWFAKQLLQDFYRAFPGVDAWKKHEEQTLMRKGYVTSFLGRRRSPVLIQIPPRVTASPGTELRRQQELREALWKAEWDAEIRKSGFNEFEVTKRETQGRASRQAINFEIQGSVAELINHGMLALLRKGWRLLGQIHDEVIIEVLPEDKERLIADLQEVYDVTIKDVPFKLDIHFGDSWAAGKD